MDVDPKAFQELIRLAFRLTDQVRFGDPRKDELRHSADQLSDALGSFRLWFSPDPVPPRGSAAADDNPTPLDSPRYLAKQELAAAIAALYRTRTDISWDSIQRDLQELILKQTPNHVSVAMALKSVGSDLSSAPAVPAPVEPVTFQGLAIGEWVGIARALWGLLDGIDTAADAYKPTFGTHSSARDHFAFITRTHRKRFEYLRPSDGNVLVPTPAVQPETKPWDEGGRDEYFSKFPGDAALVAGEDWNGSHPPPQPTAVSHGANAPFTTHVRVTLACERCKNSSTSVLGDVTGNAAVTEHIASYYRHHSRCQPQ